MLTLALAALCALASCVGIPVRREAINHIVATSWTEDGRPIALAQRFRLGRTAYIISPEGPGVFEHYRSGSLVLLIGESEVPVDTNFGDASIRVENASPLPASAGFLAISDVRSIDDLSRSIWRCFKVAVDGSTQPCVVPDGYRLEAFAYYVAADAHQIRFRRTTDEESRFEALNIDTGVVSALPVDLTTLPLRWARDTQWPSAPCDMSYSRLSPSGGRLVVVCTIQMAGDSKEGLFLVGSDGQAHLLYEFKDRAMSPAQVQYEARPRLQSMVTWPREEYSLTWSSDESRVYWCGGRGAAGVMVSLRDDPAVEHKPCLLLASWSPDGTRIAGVNQEGFVVWDVRRESSNHALQRTREAYPLPGSALARAAERER